MSGRKSSDEPFRKVRKTGDIVITEILTWTA